MFITGKSRIFKRNITLNSHQIRSYHVIKERGKKNLVRFHLASISNQKASRTLLGIGSQTIWVHKTDLANLVKEN